MRLLLMRSRQGRSKRPSLDGELLLFNLACGEFNSRRTCAVTRRDSRLVVCFLPLTNRRIPHHAPDLRCIKHPDLPQICRRLTTIMPMTYPKTSIRG